MNQRLKKRNLMYSRAMVRNLNKKRCLKKGVNKWKKWDIQIHLKY